MFSFFVNWCNLFGEMNRTGYKPERLNTAPYRAANQVWDFLENKHIDFVVIFYVFRSLM